MRASIAVAFAVADAFVLSDAIGHTVVTFHVGLRLGRAVDDRLDIAVAVGEPRRSSVALALSVCVAVAKPWWRGVTFALGVSVAFAEPRRFCVSFDLTVAIAVGEPRRRDFGLSHSHSLALALALGVRQRLACVSLAVCLDQQVAATDAVAVGVVVTDRSTVTIC
jgi:hypothetical protein